jgi:hypothetical protein
MRVSNLSQDLAVAGIVTPAQNAASSYLSETIKAGLYDRLLAVMLVGTLSGAATQKGKFQHCSGSLSSDSAWTDVDATCVTSTFSSTSNDKIANLELRLDQNPTVSAYVRFLQSIAVSSGTGATVIVGLPRYKPAADVDSASVAQIVVF